MHVTALVRQRLGVDEDPVALAGFIEQRVAGHPYFCEALVKAMQEAGIVGVTDGRAVFGELESLDLPATVQGAVLSLVDRLATAPAADAQGSFRGGTHVFDPCGGGGPSDG